MNGEVQPNIQKFLFHLSNEDHDAASQELKKVIDQKYQDRFEAAYQEVSESFSKKK
jgi:hypothetical protein